MAQNKIKIKENDGNFVLGCSMRRSTSEFDHWAFLEEIEAPMWADLTLESNMKAVDDDDAWFHTSHPFHHLSARELRSAFAHPDVGNDFVNFNLQGGCSPKLPSSVSKSRGKDYASKPRRNNDAIQVRNYHPVNDLGGRIPRLDKDPLQDCKCKVSPENQSEGTDSVTGVICSESQNSEVVVDSRDTFGSLNSQLACTSGLSTSTITSVSQRQETKLSEVSREGFSLTGGLLNSLKTNLRKSCATRPAMRVKICDDRELKGRKSSNGKSSMGSSSIGNDGKVERSAILKKTDHLEQVKMDIVVNKKPRCHKSLTGKTSMGIPSSMLMVNKIAVGNNQSRDKDLGGNDGKVERSAILKKTDHPEQVKMDIVVNKKPGCHKSLTGKTSMGIPSSMLMVNKIAVSNNHSRDKDLGGKGLEIVPVKGRVIASQVREAPLKKMVAGLKQKEYKYSNVRDIGKLAPHSEGRPKAQKPAEASVKTITRYSSKVEGRGAVAASTCLQTLKPKVLISDATTNRPKLGAPGVKEKVGRALLNGPSFPINDNRKRVPLSLISSGNYKHACCKKNRSEKTYEVN